MRDRGSEREVFRRQLVWLYATTLVGVLLLLMAAALPGVFAGVQPLGIGMTLLSAALLLAATWNAARRR